MKAHWHKIQEAWSNLAQREQRMVAIGTAAALIFIVYQFIWSPLVNHQAVLRKRIDSQQRLLAWMQYADKDFRRIQGEGKPKTVVANPVLLLGFLQNQIKQAGLTNSLKQLKQSGNDMVEMHFQRVEFDKLVTMLTKIIQNQPVSIPQFSVSADVTPGIVNADIYLKVV